MSEDDRIVHAKSGVVEIVRYDRSGKWYSEISGLRRVPLTVGQAAYRATLPGFVWFEGRPGGRRFDAKVRELQEKSPR